MKGEKKMTFTLDMPDPEKVKEEVSKELEVKEDREDAIQSSADQKAQEIMAADIDSVEGREELSQAIRDFGKDVVQKSQTKNEILSRRIVDLSKSGSESGEVATGLQELAEQMRDLDPSGVDFTESSFFSKISHPVRRYFDKYKSADAEIGEIVKSLEKGKTSLQNDNITLEVEEGSMRDITKQLNEKIAMGTSLDQYLTEAVEKKKAEGGDENKVKFIEEEVLFPLRQRLMDFQQLQVVNQQGVVAMDVLRRNNNELIRAVERAETVTVSSLRTAVTVAGALYNQKIVLQKVQTLNAATNQMIQSTSEMLKQQGTQIQQQSSEANISPETLKKSFEETLSALDDISKYKQEALPKMRQTIEEFRTIADEGEKRLTQMEKAGAFDNLTSAEEAQKKLEDASDKTK